MEQKASIFLKQRAGEATPKDLLPFLDNARDEPPGPGDEINERSN